MVAFGAAAIEKPGYMKRALRNKFHAEVYHPVASKFGARTDCRPDSDWVALILALSDVTSSHELERYRPLEVKGVPPAPKLLPQIRTPAPATPKASAGTPKMPPTRTSRYQFLYHILTRVTSESENDGKSSVQEIRYVECDFTCSFN